MARYCLKVLELNPQTQGFRVLLLEDDQQEVARVRFDGQAGEITFSYQWADEAAHRRFVRYINTQPDPEAVMLLSGQNIRLSREEKQQLRMDAFVADLLDQIKIREIAEKNTLYRLKGDCDGQIRIAPSPDDEAMQKALYMVFGDELEMVMNGKMANPESEESKQPGPK